MIYEDIDDRKESSASPSNSASKHILMHLDNTRANITFRTPKPGVSGSNPLIEAIKSNALSPRNKDLERFLYF